MVQSMVPNFNSFQSNCLFNIVNSPSKVAYTVVVVMDSTGTYRSNDSYSYVTKLKVVDSSYNNMTPNNKLLKYAFIFIYSSTFETAPRKIEIGDLLVLRRVNFSTYETKEGLSIRGNLSIQGSEWYVVKFQSGSNLTIVESNRNLSKLLSNEKKFLTSLQEWKKTYFLKNSLLDMGWYDVLNYSEESFVAEYRSVDLLIFVQEVRQQKTSQGVYFIFKGVTHKDLHVFGNFLLEEKTLVAGEIYKLRSVSVIKYKKVGKIVYSLHSSLLHLQKEAFLDTKRFKEFFNNDSENIKIQSQVDELNNFLKKDYNIFEDKSLKCFFYFLNFQSNVIYKQLMQIFPFLENFNLKELFIKNNFYIARTKKLFSLIKNETKDIEITNFEELIELLEKLATRPAMLNSHVGKRYKVVIHLKKFMIDEENLENGNLSISILVSSTIDDLKQIEISSTLNLEDKKSILPNIIPAKSLHSKEPSKKVIQHFEKELNNLPIDYNKPQTLMIEILKSKTQDVVLALRDTCFVQI